MDHEKKDLDTRGRENILAGKTAQALGKGQQKVGRFTNDADLEARGDINQMHGATEATYGNVQHHVHHQTHEQATHLGTHGTEHEVKGGVNKTIGKVEEKIGELTRNHELEAKGRAKQVGGTIESTLGRGERKLGDHLDPDQ